MIEARVIQSVCDLWDFIGHYTCLCCRWYGSQLHTLLGGPAAMITKWWHALLIFEEFSNLSNIIVSGVHCKEYVTQIANSKLSSYKHLFPDLTSQNIINTQLLKPWSHEGCVYALPYQYNVLLIVYNEKYCSWPAVRGVVCTMHNSASV